MNALIFLVPEDIIDIRPRLVCRSVYISFPLLLLMRYL